MHFCKSEKMEESNKIFNSSNINNAFINEVRISSINYEIHRKYIKKSYISKHLRVLSFSSDLFDSVLEKNKSKFNLFSIKIRLRRSGWNTEKADWE